MRQISKRFYLYAGLVLVILIVVTCFVGKKSLSNTAEAEKLEGEPIKYKSTGSIIKDGNEYYNRYVISLNEASSDVKWEINREFVGVTLPNKEAKDIAVKGKSSSKINNVFLTSKNKKNVIKFKNLYSGENHVYYDPLDNKKLVVLISKKKDPYKYKVVLDPGHGGSDNGTRNGDLLEKNLTLKIVKNMPQNLWYDGCKVYLTREDDVLNSLNHIYTFSNDLKADAFVSVHINYYAKSSSYSGIETHCEYPDGFQKDIRLQLANDVQNEAVKSDGWNNRGVKVETNVNQMLKVLHHSTVPSVLVECGFLSNPDDLKRLKSDSALNNLSVNISNGILEFLKSQNKKQ